MTTANTPKSSTVNPFVSFDINGAFAAPRNPFAVEAPAAQRPAGEVGYAMKANGPALDAREVEDAAVEAVEVVVAWGHTVLRVDHLTPARAYVVGDTKGQDAACDFDLPSVKLGRPSAQVVDVVGGRSMVVVPAGAQGWVELPGKGRSSFEALGAALEAHPALAGARCFALSAGVKARIELGDISITVASVAAGKRNRGAMLRAASLTGLMFAGLSLLGHASLLGGLAFFKPALDGADDEAERREHLVQMQQLLNAAAEKETEPVKEETANTSDGSEGSQGARAQGPSGSMGSSIAKSTGGKFAIAGRKDNPDVHISREQQRAEAASFGLIGLMQADVGGHVGPSAAWGRDTAEGRDSISANGAMWGDALGESFGNGGLDLSGIGFGSNGKGEGIGLDSVGTIGNGRNGNGTQGFGNSHGKPQGTHQVKAPSIIQGVTTASGRLPADVIQRIIRQNFGRFKMCYLDGLRSNPNLQGRVAVRFVIGRNGAVSNVSNGGSDLPDSNVVGCVVRSFSGLSFPEPESGIVTVTYPISFAPGG